MNLKLESDYVRKYLGKLLLILNCLCVILGICYINIKYYTSTWNVFGVILIAALVGNFLLAYINNIVLIKKNHKEIKVIRILGYVYLINNIFAMFGMMIGNITLSNSYFNNLKDDKYVYILIYLSYFSIFIFGMVLSYLSTANFKIQNNYNKEDRGRILKGFFKILCYIVLIFGVFFSWIILTRHDIRNLEVYTVGFSVFFGFIFWSNLIILLSLKVKDKNTKIYYFVSIIGTAVVVICILSFVLTPYTIKKCEKEFSEAFGKEWREKIDKNHKKYLLKTPFCIPAYFLGIDSHDFVVKKDIMFYKGTDSNKKEVKLYFDVYMPKKLDKSLPGIGTCIIRIHGGAWVAGDKGEMNMLQMNKYFAGQGYTVFDIQYGLSNNSSLTLELGEGDNVKGNFNIDDMIKHIGIFTKYLERNAEEYGANLDSVFISGGSAGGHLSTAAALAIKSGRYDDIFSNKINIKGIIPFYPANGLSNLGEIGGREEFVNPISLVEKSSPPCLIYQGTRDSLVPIELSENLKNKYILKGNERCAIMRMPLGGHGSDYYFSGQYNQVFLYYMERFIYIYK
ncbi:alpha/beta hydrolase fold domain-containing protein [Clostridium sp.]|uniref:alpha/beta hydrolase fold domain-containing protein n=1 Tax=Clostridium sp. TaxID=1506 RepID=UPI0039F4EF32